MTIHNLSETPSLLDTFISEIRDVTIQKDSMRFRRNIERIGEIMGYELSKTLSFETSKTQTPLGASHSKSIVDSVVLCSILRAGIPLHNGLLNYFDRSESAFVSAYRHHNDNSKAFEIVVEYLACPNLEGKTLILADPMLATGQSLVATFNALKAFGNPASIYLMSIIAAPEGVNYISKFFPDTTHLWLGTIDQGLNDVGYIIPGLGDAGDLTFGEKLQK